MVRQRRSSGRLADIPIIDPHPTQNLELEDNRSSFSMPKSKRISDITIPRYKELNNLLTPEIAVEKRNVSMRKPNKIFSQYLPAPTNHSQKQVQPVALEKVNSPETLENLESKAESSKYPKSRY